VNKLTISTVLIRKGKFFWKIFQKIFRFKIFREIFITTHTSTIAMSIYPRAVAVKQAVDAGYRKAHTMLNTQRVSNLSPCTISKFNSG
jgi:hypothetical protein